MPRITLSSVYCSAPAYIPHCLIKHTIFLRAGERGVILHKTCLFIFSTNFVVIFLIVRKIQRVTIIDVHMSSRKIPDILATF